MFLDLFSIFSEGTWTTKPGSLSGITGDQETTSQGAGAGTRAARAARSCERGAGEEEPRSGEGPMPLVVALNEMSLVLF